MSKSFLSLGLMSGTSADGVDASIIQSDGDNQFKVILDQYFKYNQDIYDQIHNLKDAINDSKDLRKLSNKINRLEKKITIFHANVVNKLTKKNKLKVDLVGFHGQTIFHNAKEKISKQLGDGKLLAKLTKKNVVYNFRENDIKNGGEGAPLTPIFHKLLKKKFKIKEVTFVNIGGIVNLTKLKNNNMSGSDIGPGMCLIDYWLRHKSSKKYDDKGNIAKSGKIIEKELNFLIRNFKEKISKKKNIKSFDTKHFNFKFDKKLSLKNGAATLTEFTAKIIISELKKNHYKSKIILCGGGRKNDFLVEKLRKKINSIKLIDTLGVDGDFVESQAFAYLAIRSFLQFPISFPETTGVKKPCKGGVVIKY